MDLESLVGGVNQGASILSDTVVHSSGLSRVATAIFHKITYTVLILVLDQDTVSSGAATFIRSSTGLPRHQDSPSIISPLVILIIPFWRTAIAVKRLYIDEESLP